LRRIRGTLSQDPAAPPVYQAVQARRLEAAK